MPQTINKYRILVASPSDVRDERESMDEVIDELNITYGNKANKIIELIKWETHSAPAVSEASPQDIIDKDLGTDYDLFIGILWKKFGTPTKECESGTEQEFRNAYSRFKRDPKSLQILFYFKTASPMSLSDIEPHELKKVNEFKNEIGDKGVYYWEYNTNEELQKFLRMHIPKRLDELGEPSANTKSKIASIETPLEEELGVIDYQEIIEESFNDSTQALLRITDATKWVGSEINKKTTELNSLTSSKQDISKKVLRDFFGRTADIMNNFASRIEPDIPIFIKSFEKGSDALFHLVTIYRSDFSISNEEDIRGAINSLEGLMSGIESSLSGTKSFLDTISNLPRMAKELNQARRNVEAKLEELINKLIICHSIVIELQKNLHKK
ncbi:MAG: hypothetical protein C0417_02425 [Chlorobiaceae bacterium]|nr:hypothetical protein [Chlorobiaceae bacterium]